MDGIEGLRSLGFTLPSPAYIFGTIAFGIIGFACYRYGKKTGQARRKWLGVALMLYPYLTPSTWLLYTVGAALCAAVWFDRG